MTAREAAQWLRISRDTLYAYVSRGLLRSWPGAVRLRGHRYLRSEVEQLARQRAGARIPRRVAQASLDWGLPVLDSALTLVRDGRLHYRGQDAVALAQAATLEQVAALLWDIPVESFAVPVDPLPSLARQTIGALATDDARACLGRFAALQAMTPSDEGAPFGAAAVRLLRLMVTACTSQATRAEGAHRELARAWAVDEAAADILRQALVLCADHELNASSFTARCVASTGASLGAAVTAGLAALTGPRHGGMTNAVERWWTGDRATQPDAALHPHEPSRWETTNPADRDPPRARPLAPGVQTPGFGHPLYPQGDPRAAALLAAMPADPARDVLVQREHQDTGLRPTLDFALVALRRSLGLPPGAAFTLFAVGRTVGWLAHALEQARDAALIRPRAAYVGAEPPKPATPAPAGRIIRRR